MRITHQNYILTFPHYFTFLQIHTYFDGSALFIPASFFVLSWVYYACVDIPAIISDRSFEIVKGSEFFVFCYIQYSDTKVRLVSIRNFQQFNFKTKPQILGSNGSIINRVLISIIIIFNSGITRQAFHFLLMHSWYYFILGYQGLYLG